MLTWSRCGATLELKCRCTAATTVSHCETAASVSRGPASTHASAAAASAAGGSRPRLPSVPATCRATPVCAAEFVSYSFMLL